MLHPSPFLSSFSLPFCTPPPPGSPPPSFTALWFVGIWRMSPSRPCRPHISAERSWDVTGCDFSLSSLYHLRDRSATWLQCRRTARHRSPRCISSPRAIAEIKTIHATYHWLWRVHRNRRSSFRICAFLTSFHLLQERNSSIYKLIAPFSFSMELL